MVRKWNVSQGIILRRKTPDKCVSADSGAE
jgi:hypothetical protein